MRYYPVYLDIRQRRCLVVGGGAVATRKATALLDCDAKVTVVSPDITLQLRELAAKGALKLIVRAYRSSDLKGMFLVIGATDDEGLNRRISRDARDRNMLVNIADRPQACNFILPAIVRRGDLVIAISTSGQSPALAKKLRQQLENQFGEEYGRLLILMGAIRQRLLAHTHKPEAHKHLFNELIDRGLPELMRANRQREINDLLAEILGSDYNFEALMEWDH